MLAKLKGSITKFKVFFNKDLKIEHSAAKQLLYLKSKMSAKNLNDYQKAQFILDESDKLAKKLSIRREHYSKFSLLFSLTISFLIIAYYYRHELISKFEIDTSVFTVIYSDEYLRKHPTVKNTITGPRTTFEDVCGNEDVIEELKQVVDYYRDSSKYDEIGAVPISGIMLFGPPGCGKTLIAKALASESKMSFIAVGASSFGEMYYGKGASRVKDLFRIANKIAPCVIFIDEIDELGRDNNPDTDMTVNELLQQLDGFKSRKDIMVVGATNVLEKVDKALLRPGRFDISISMWLPDKNARQKILALNLKKTNLAADCDLERVAKDTILLSGADLANVANTAKLRTAKSGKREVSLEDLEEAVMIVSKGLERRSVNLSESTKNKLATGRAAGALAAMLLNTGLELRRVSIVPRGMALGHCQSVVIEETPFDITSSKKLYSRILVYLADRVGEELAFGQNGSTSASSEGLVKATALARSLVANMGAGESLGYRELESSNNHFFYFVKDSLCDVDRQAKLMIERAEKEVTALLLANKERLVRIKDELLQRETLYRADLLSILEQVPSQNGSL